MRFSDTRLVERVLEAQRALCSSDLQCYALGLRGQDAVREKVGMSRFAIEGDEGGKNPVFFAKAELLEQGDLFGYMESELGTPFLKGRMAVPRQRWHSLFEKAPNSWEDFLHRVLMLLELSILDAYQTSVQASKSESKKPQQTTAEASEIDAQWKDEQAVGATTLGKCAKRKVRKNRHATKLKGRGAGEEDRSLCGESRAESVADESAPSVLDDCVSESVASASTQFQSLAASGSALDDDAASVSTADAAAAPPKAEDDTEDLQVDWSATQPIGPVAQPLETVRESVALEVDWNEAAAQPEETRWSVEMVDAATGVRAEWHWVSTPQQMLTCGNLRAHIKNGFVDDIYDHGALPKQTGRAKSAPAPRRKRSP